MSLHVVTYDENACKGCGNCTFCEGPVTRGSGLWMHRGYFSNQITFSEIEMWTPKEAFSQQNKINSWFYFFYPRKNKVDFFQVKCFQFLVGAGAGVSSEPSDVSTADVRACGVRRGRRMLRADRKPNASHSSPFALSSSPPRFPVLSLWWYTGKCFPVCSPGEKRFVYKCTCHKFWW